jgi:hypothetical protein
MLIVKNLFSFYVEFEILLHFLLFCRFWNVNKDVNMRNDAWNEMDQTYTKNQVKNTSEQNLRTTIIKLRTTIMGFALWFALIRKCKNCGPQF